MIKEFIGTGSTIEAATNAAKAGLNAPAMADVKIEIIEMPKKKVLGIFGGKDAKVKASFEDLSGSKQRKGANKRSKKQPDYASKQPAAGKKAPVAPKQEAKAEERAKSAPQAKAESKGTPATQSDADAAVAYLTTIVNGLKIDDFKINSSIEGDTVRLVIECEDYGIIIGRRGETLDALQYLTSLAIKKNSESYVRVTIDVGNYREKREETLRSLAFKHAAFVARSGRRFTFEPMNPYERRVIHTAIQEFDGVESKSIGYNQDRRVVLEPEGGARRYSGSPRSNGQRRSQPYRSSAPKSAENAAPRADRADLPTFGKIEINKD